MKSKEFIYLFLLFTVMSCNQSPEEVINQQNHERVAVEILTHSISVDQIYLLSKAEEDAFNAGILPAYLNPELSESLRIRSFAVQGDTILSFDEVPVIRESLTKTIIFSDGTCESIFEDLTPENMNIMINLTETSIPDSMRITRTIVKDGLICIYDKTGRLISRESYPEENYTEFLDTLRYYVKMNEESVQSTRAMKIAALRKRLPSDVHLEMLLNGHVVYEMNVSQQTGHTGQSINVQTATKYRTEIDPDLNRTLSFEMYEDNKLVHKKTYQYSDNNKLMNYAGNRNLGYNPERIESYTLIKTSTGKPAIRHIKEFFRQNQTHIPDNL